MKQEELLQQYNTLKTALDNGDITEKYFQESVDELRYEDAQGVWHQINSETGDWLYWKDDQWQSEPKSSQTKRSAKSSKPNTNLQQPLPQGFWSLLGLIFKNTLKMFFKKLPRTLFFIFLALVLHTFLLVVVNNGFNPEKFIGNFLSLSFNLEKGASPLNGIIIWTIVPMLVMGLFGPKSSGPNFGDRLSIVGHYFRDAKKDASAVILGSLGVSLTIGALINGYSSLIMAVGIGTLFASKSGSVIALLFRSAWTSIFSVARRDNISRYGLATGYVTIFASSLGFIANSALTPYGVAIGILLLVAAIAMAKGTQISPAAIPLLIPGVIILSSSFFGFDLLWADDGGFNDPSGGGGRGTFPSWWDGSSRNLAILMGIPPAIAAGFAPLIQRVLRDMADNLPPDLDRSSGSTLIDENGNPLEQREDGLYGWEVGDETQWLTREEAEEQIQEELDARSRRDREREAFWEEGQKKSNEWMDKKGEEGLRSQQEMADRLAAEEASEQREEKKNEELVEKLDKISKNGYSKFEDLVDDMKENEDWVGLQEIYYDRLKDMVKDSAAVSERESTKASAYWAGEKVAQFTKSASKGALMVLGGPAGGVATGIAVGSISAAEEGAESQAKGEKLGTILAHTAGGFVSGFKDGAVSVYVNIPGTSKVTKILLPAGTDAAEVYIKTGDGKKALEAAGYSVASDLVGLETDKIGNKAIREVAEATTTATVSGTQTYVNGGNFSDGVGNGLLNHVGGKAGGSVAGHLMNKIDNKSAIKNILGIDDSESSIDNDLDHQVKQALDEVYEESNQIIKTEDLPENIQNINNTRRQATESEGEYRTTLDENGNSVKKEYIDTKLALDQLQDTQSSRASKQAEPGLKNAMIDTRDDKIYSPPNEATLNTVKNSSDPDTQKWLQKNMQEGDVLEMDNFSTPGKNPSLGADRDVRMVINRYNPDTDTYTKIEVPRKHWEDQAYKDFYEHGQKLYADSGQDLDAEIQRQIDNGEGNYASRNKNLSPLQQPEFNNKQLDDMRDDFRSRIADQDNLNNRTRTQEEVNIEVEKRIERISNQGLTADQVKHRTFAEAHNQLFTDKFHMEASRANSDQGFNEIKNQGVENTQVRSNILDAKDGKERLTDHEGFARMWDEKSHFYHDNPSEALAQSKKGIAEMMGLREGERTQGLNPAPLKPETAEAMEIVVRAPTGADATPQALERINQEIQAITDSDGRQVYQDTNDAMSKIGKSVEYNKFTPSAIKYPEGLTGNTASRIARLEQEREWARKLDDDSYSEEEN